MAPRETTLNHFKSLVMEGKHQSMIVPCIITDRKVSTIDACEKFMLDDCKTIVGGRLEFRDGKAWIYEVPRRCHSDAATELTRNIDRALGDHEDNINIGTNTTMRDNNQHFVYEPDGYTQVRGGGQPGPDDEENRAEELGGRYPNIIVEVAYSESQQHVQNKAAQWLQTSPTKPEYGVQQVIAIKIGRNPRASGHRTMSAF